MASKLSALIALLLNCRLARAYRPELYYMRGPGPKCREKGPLAA